MYINGNSIIVPQISDQTLLAQYIMADIFVICSNKEVLAVAPNIMSERNGGKCVLKLADMMKEEKITFVLVGE